MKFFLLTVALLQALVFSGCQPAPRFVPGVEVETGQPAGSSPAAAKFTERFFAALDNGDEAACWPMLSVIEKRRDSTKVRSILRDGYIPAMRGFDSWSSPPAVTKIRSLDATPEFPGPLYMVERLSKRKDGKEECLAAIVQFDRNNHPYVENLYRGKTQMEARAKMIESAKVR